MINLGKVKPGTTVYIPFHTFDSNDPSASVTITGLALADIAVYKDGGTTERASTAGFTLLDTDGIDFDTITGTHGVSIDLSDNTTANFYEAGSRYMVRIGPITVDAATINFWSAIFEIGYEGAILDTTVATLASQTSFTLEEGPADDDALIGCRALIHDLASSVQIAQALVSDYVGTTRTVTLVADPGIFTMAAGDNVSFFMRTDPSYWNGARITTTLETAADVADAVLDEDMTGHQTTGTLGAAIGDGDAGAGMTALASQASVDTIDANVDAVLLDTAEIGAAGAGLTVLATQASVDTVDANVDATLVDTAAILVDTGTTLPASIATVDTNVDNLNLGIIYGTAQTGTLSTTQATTDLTGYLDDELIGGVIIFTGGTADGQRADITDYAAASGLVTFTGGITTAPANGDTFKIV